MPLPTPLMARKPTKYISVKDKGKRERESGREKERERKRKREREKAPLNPIPDVPTT